MKEQIQHLYRPQNKGCCMRKNILILTLLLILASLFAWSPWWTQENVSKLAENQFNHAWAGVADGCGTASADLGVEGFHKVPFGAYVTITYQCGLVEPNAPPLHTDIYILFTGTAFGYPKP